MKCWRCGIPGAEVLFQSVACPNPRCQHYSDTRLEQVQANADLLARVYAWVWDRWKEGP